jgi:hypothetical protein
MSEQPDDIDLDEPARENPGIADSLEELRRAAAELVPECADFEEFAEMLGLGSVCEVCGRKGLDADDFADCDLVMDNDPEVFGHLVCNGCLNGADPDEITWQALIQTSRETGD